MTAATAMQLQSSNAPSRAAAAGTSARVAGGRRLTVCLISEEFPPEAVGGIGTYTADLARGLVALGHRVHVVTRTWYDEGTRDQNGVTVHGVPIPEPSWAWGTWWINLRFHETRHIIEWGRRAWSTVRRIAEREPIDVVECPEYHAQALAAPFVDSRIPLVIKLHTPAVICRQLNGAGVGGSSADVRLSEWSERLAARFASLLTAPSAAMAADVATAWRINPTTIRVIPNPVDDELFSPSPAAARDGATITFAGRIERRKGVEPLARAIPLILRARPDARFRFVGRDHPSGPDGTSMTDHLRAILRDAQVPDGVPHFQGPAAREGLPAIYGSAALCVVPSLYESFGYTCVEAMATGAPVVASRAGALPEIITHNQDGLLVTPGSERELADAILSLLADPARAAALGRAARATVSARYTCTAVAARTVEAYRSIPGVRT